MPLLAIDQGTTSTRVMVFDDTAQPLSIARRELQQHYPERGWVEHDVEDIWRDLPGLMREAVEQAGVPVSDIAGIGITNQRETTVLWDRRTGEPVHRAIVWQDRRTAAACRQLIDDGVEPMIRQKTGLLLDPYFSATKLAWLLDHVPQARDRAVRGELCFGTIDSFLLFRLTRGRLHATDATNAARTMLFNIHTQDWDDELLRLFAIPRAILPEVRDSSGDFGTTSLLGPAIPIAGVAGDQQAATFGQACFTPGMIKSTYGTGCFALMNTGTQVVESRNRLLSTVAYRLNGRPVYAVEGAIFVAGAAVKWLRDRLRVITHASQTDDLATRVADNHGVYFVPAFVGLGAPYWDAEARAAIHGLTFDAGPEHIARAALEAVGFQTRDLIEAMIADGAQRPKALRVDGGMVANDWLCQFLSGMADLPVDRPAVIETTAFGAACLAGLHVGVFPDLAAITAARRSARTFTPDMDAERRTRLYAGWQTAVAAVRTQHRGQNAAPSPA